MIINPTMLINDSSKGDNEDMFIDLSGYTPVENYSDSILDKELLAVADFVTNTSRETNFNAISAYISIYTDNHHGGDSYSSHDICSICLCIKSDSSNTANRVDYFTPFVRFKIPLAMKTYLENMYSEDSEEFSITWQGCHLFVKN